MKWLMDMAQQLVEGLGLLGNKRTETANTPKDYHNFLMEVLRKVSENPNPKLIYPFLAQNLDKLDDNLIKILENWAQNTLESVETEESEYFAAVISMFSTLVRDFSRGDIAVNKEIAIAGNSIALTVLTFNNFPKNWAEIQHNLGNA